MVDDNLIGQLKKYIKEHYKLAGEPLPPEQPEGLTKRKGLGKLVQHSHQPSVPSFEDIADTLSRFIGKERKSETFSTMLERLRKEKKMTAAQLYNGAWIKKQLYSKIMGERNYHPSKNTVIAFGLSLRLDRSGMDQFLESAGYLLSNSSIADLVILFCLDQGLYDLHDVNALLLSADQKVVCRE
jgi:hypothetical protein